MTMYLWNDRLRISTAQDTLNAYKLYEERLLAEVQKTRECQHCRLSQDGRRRMKIVYHKLMSLKELCIYGGLLCADCGYLGGIHQFTANERAWLKWYYGNIVLLQTRSEQL